LSTAAEIIFQFVSLIPWKELANINRQCQGYTTWWYELQRNEETARIVMDQIWTRVDQHFGLDYDGKEPQYQYPMFAKIPYFEEVRVGVYFLQGENGYIKIGKSDHIWRRYRSIERHSPVRVSLVGYILTNDSDALEKELHERFKDNRMRYEWFSPTNELRDLILKHGGKLKQ
jgi:hypothetical protein